MSERSSLLVLGLGNVLLEDDGVGSAAVAQLLERFDAPAGVRVLDGGTLGLSLLPYFDEADSVVLVDAVRADGSPGTLVRLDGDDVGPAVATRLSPHQVGVADLLDGARWLDRYPRHVVLLGIVPQSIDLGLGLSPAVRASLPELVTLVVGEALAQGFAFKPKTAGETAPARQRINVAHLAGMR
jgi:hydrogenase maturation protease